MKALIAVNNLGFIGKDNKLMWRSSADLAHFKSLTLNSIMLCGYNTYQTLPKVVKERAAVILWTPETIFKDLQLNQTICIGGKKTYERLSHLFTELHISLINDNQIGDCRFPDFTNLNPACKIFTYHFEVNE